MGLLDVGPWLKLHSSKTFKLAYLEKGMFVNHIPTQAFFTAECAVTLFFLTAHIKQFYFQ